MLSCTLLSRSQGVDAPRVLRRNKRLRVYAKEVDREGKRIKLTCRRPKSRPRCGPVPALASEEHLEEFDYDDSSYVLYDDDEDDEDYDDDDDEDYEEEDWGEEDEDADDWFYQD